MPARRCCYCGVFLVQVQWYFGCKFWACNIKQFSHQIFLPLHHTHWIYTCLVQSWIPATSFYFFFSFFLSSPVCAESYIWEKNKTPLIAACEAGDKDTVFLLLSKPDIDVNKCIGVFFPWSIMIVTKIISF